MKKVLISLIRIYQKYISRFTVRSCRFYPTCSEYCIQALEKYGLLKGIFISIRRILKCNPFNPGGYDPLK